MATGDIIGVQLAGTFGGEPFRIGIGFVSNSGATTWSDETSALGGEIVAALELDSLSGAFMAPLSVQFKLDALLMQDLSPGVSSMWSYGIGRVGGNETDDAMPPNDALCVTWRTGLKGVANRGRSYLSGFAEDSNNAGYWIPEIQDWAASEFAEKLMAAFGPVGSGNYALSVIHKQSGGAPLVPPTATPIIGYQVHNEVRTLRRRAVGVRVSRRRVSP